MTSWASWAPWWGSRCWYPDDCSNSTGFPFSLPSTLWRFHCQWCKYPGLMDSWLSFIQFKGQRLDFWNNNMKVKSLLTNYLCCVWAPMLQSETCNFCCGSVSDATTQMVSCNHYGTTQKWNESWSISTLKIITPFWIWHMFHTYASLS